MVPNENVSSGTCITNIASKNFSERFINGDWRKHRQTLYFDLLRGKHKIICWLILEKLFKCIILKRYLCFPPVLSGLINKGKYFWHHYVCRVGTELLKSKKVARMNSHFIDVPSKNIWNKNFKSPYKHSNLHVLVFSNWVYGNFFSRSLILPFLHQCSFLFQGSIAHMIFIIDIALLVKCFVMDGN